MSQPETPINNASDTELKTWSKPSLHELDAAANDVLANSLPGSDGGFFGSS